ncbi:Acyltransferase [Klebsormidium nitens]|uniref:Acyltransferase n=1 Tax=Klebsormidium nitens TaxID=105231 RepID=A0A1Y1HWN8_KLENI|nr:Acyltransferase [Klebsormidium nitens]|eukprot:GAQ82573.1 Acyltransferase [Klebsormidium nitens]
MSSSKVSSGPGRPLQEASKKPPKPVPSRRTSGEFDRTSQNGGGVPVGGGDRPNSNGVLHSESREGGASADLPASDQEITAVVQSVFAGEINREPPIPTRRRSGGFVDTAAQSVVCDAAGVPLGPEYCPFIEKKSPVTFYELFKMAILLPTVPIRVGLIIFVLLQCAVVVTLATWGAPSNEPFSPWRRKLIARWARPSISIVLFLLGFRIRVHGIENAWDGWERKAVMVANHVSYIDPLFAVAVFAPSGVAKTSSVRIPLIGQIAQGFQPLLIDRTRFTQNQTATGNKEGTAALIAARAADARYPPIFMFPEGTTSNGHCLLQFQRGAFVAGAPIIPVLLNYKYKYFNPAWTNCSIPLAIFRLLCQFANYLDVTILPLYTPSEDERRDPALYASNMRKHMAGALGVPMIEQSLGEYLKSLKHGVKMDWLMRRQLGPPWSLVLRA